MIAVNSYALRKATSGDLAKLHAWLTTPHVAEWWGADRTYNQKDLADPRVARWIVACNGRPFAFMQDYTVHGWPDHHFASLPTGARGIDQFIGEPEMVGIGHGSVFIRARVHALFDAGAPVVATDPHPDNKRAIAVYTKVGFEPFGPPQVTQWGMILPMLMLRKTRVAPFQDRSLR